MRRDVRVLRAFRDSEFLGGKNGMSTMRRIVAVLSIGVGVVITGCSSDSSSNGGGGGSTGSTGSTGAGGAATRNACKTTNCPVDETPIPDSVCNLILGSHCKDVAMAYFACSLAHDNCQADGTQDGSIVTTSCVMETDNFTTCDPLGEGGIY